MGKSGKLGYTVEKLDPCGLWRTGDVNNYNVTNYLKNIKVVIDLYSSQNPEEILLIGHSLGAFVSVVAGKRFKEVKRIISLCSPPDYKLYAQRWDKDGFRRSSRELPGDSSKFRNFSVPISFLHDAQKYSAVDEIKNLNKPVMIFMGLDDEVVLPGRTEELVTIAKNAYVAKKAGIGHDFRKSERECNIVMDEIEKFLAKI